MNRLDLIHYVLPTPKSGLVCADGSDTPELYPAASPPHPDQMPQVVFDQNHTILQRVTNALQRGLGQLSDDTTFPSTHLGTPLYCYMSNINYECYASTARCYPTASLCDAAHVLMVPIFEALGARIIDYAHRDAQGFSLNYVVIPPKHDKSLATVTSVQFEAPAALACHWGSASENLDLQQIKPSAGLEAMLFKLWIQMCDHDYKARFGLIFARHSFILVERWGESALIVSPIYSVFDAPTAPNTLKAPGGSAPILACLLAFACCKLPGFNVREPPQELVESFRAAGSEACPAGPLQARHPSSDVQSIGSPFDEHGIGQRNGTNLAFFAYYAPRVSKVGRPASQVEFVPFLKPGVPSPHILSSHSDPYHHPASKLSPNVRGFLEQKQKPAQPFEMRFRSHLPRSNPSLEFILSDRIGRGRTGEVWHTSSSGSDTLETRWAAKVISVRELPSVVRETLFYQCVFPGSILEQFVPRYHGTYASCCGGWFVIMLEHAGEPVQGLNYDTFAESDRKPIRDLEDVFLAAGVCHRDIRPPNVLRGSDGKLRLIDFGYSELVDPAPAYLNASTA